MVVGNEKFEVGEPAVERLHHPVEEGCWNDNANRSECHVGNSHNSCDSCNCSSSCNHGVLGQAATLPSSGQVTRRRIALLEGVVAVPAIEVHRGNVDLSSCRTMQGQMLDDVHPKVEH